MKRPIIGITCPWSVETWGDDPVRGGYFYAGRSYVEAVARFGGTPLLIPPEQAHLNRSEQITQITDAVDGLLFTGGGDVKRKEGAKPAKDLREQQSARYDFEAELLRVAFAKKKPILGICRGFQMIIETFGGNLAEDMREEHKQHIPYQEPCHTVRIASESRLYRALQVETKPVNSIHVQHAGKVPDGFIVSARADDGVIEAVEYAGEQFVLGLQFHPEELVKKNSDFASIFKLYLSASIGEE